MIGPEMANKSMQNLATAMTRVGLNNQSTNKEADKDMDEDQMSPLEEGAMIVNSDDPKTDVAIEVTDFYSIRYPSQVMESSGWKSHNQVLRVEQERENFIFLMPPHPQVYVIVGASLAHGLAAVDFSNSGDARLKKAWNRTAFVRLPNGTADFFIKWGSVILQKTTELIKSNAESDVFHPVNFLLMPFYHDTTNNSWSEETTASRLTEVAKLMTARCAGNSAIHASFQYLEGPVHLKLQSKSLKTTKIVREINQLIDSTAPIARPWASLMEETSSLGEPGALACSTFRHLKAKTTPSVYKPDGLHLTPLGYSIYLTP